MTTVGFSTPPAAAALSPSRLSAITAVLDAALTRTGRRNWGSAAAWRLEDSQGRRVVESSAQWRPRAPSEYVSASIVMSGSAAGPWTLHVQAGRSADVELHAVVPHLPQLIRAMLEPGHAFAVGAADLERAADSPMSVSIYGLGRNKLRMTGPGGTLELSGRLSEVAVMVASAPNGLTREQLAVALDDRELAPSTVRAAITRLNRVVGFRLIRADPYAMTVEVDADWLNLRVAASDGRTEQIVHSYQGALLPLSHAPGVVELREQIHLEARCALLASADTRLMSAALLQPHFHDDVELLLGAAHVAPRKSALSRLARARLARIG